MLMLPMHDVFVPPMCKGSAARARLVADTVDVYDTSNSSNDLKIGTMATAAPAAMLPRLMSLLDLCMYGPAVR